MEIAPAARLTDDGDTSVNAHPGPALLNDHSSDDGEDNLGRDRADDASDGVDSDMEDSAVPAKYLFKTSHLQRLFRQYDWYSYDESTCMSWFSYSTYN